ncbi:hypothetical protein E0H82_12750 [Acinetobacter sp. ANC 4910]|uniref:hypothetical protein n=1 Tax=Acinetobacter sp. ANC 4910 TaxID=2529850 RepID=UPI00103A2F15|nr:hypothetical protein [Acinetobacter sp. ANC 4910]TCB33997.1 hypothetical protein E0H82_12750 [Acinetobacter sp. ANC 4910]
MAFDLVQYFAEQIHIQKPELLNQYQFSERKAHLAEINTLSLAKLISLWRTDENKLYQEIQSQEQLYIIDIARHLTTSDQNHSTLKKDEFEHTITEVLSLQLTELKQLDDTGHYGIKGLRELITGQVEHLSGQAADWVWSTSELTELKGSKPMPEEELSLEETMKEFNQMVHQNNVAEHHEQVTEVEKTVVPTWAKILEPVVALAVLWVLYSAATQMFA